MVLTKRDETKIKDIVREGTSGLMEGHSDLRDDIQSLKENVTDLTQKVDLLPTKEEFFSEMDKVIAPS